MEVKKDFIEFIEFLNKEGLCENSGTFSTNSGKSLTRFI